MSHDDKSFDLLGLKPVADAAKIVTDGTVKGAGAFLSRICLPAAEEFGLLLRDRVGAWRAQNAIKIVAKAEALNRKRENPDSLHGHPRMIMLAIEEGSWTESDVVQDMWSGLLSSSCENDGGNEDNLIFMNILKQLTYLQARVLNYAVENCNKFQSIGKFILAQPKEISGFEALATFDCKDLHTLDYQLDFLREIGLLVSPGGFQLETGNVILSPTALAISFYVRCQGFVGAPMQYFQNLPEFEMHHRGLEVRPQTAG